jgi:predicted AAA+ superfamily ATPase
VIRLILEEELRFVEGFDIHNVRKIYQLLSILAMNVPFKPNITKLSEKTGINRTTLVQYLHYLEKAKLINSLSVVGKSISILQKPDKIYLENPNLHQVLASNESDKGSIRESFFMNQLKNAKHQISLPNQGDFLVDDIHTFEVGGKGKNSKQIEGLVNAYIAADDIETGLFNKIPLWMFGLLY